MTRGIVNSKTGLTSMNSKSGGHALKPCTFLVFGDDWGRHPSSSQHLIRGFLHGHKVVWVNSIGMRSPQLTQYDADRVLQRLKHSFGHVRKIFRSPDTPSAPVQGSPRENSSGLKPTVVDPVFLPFHKHKAIQAFNRLSIGKQLSSVNIKKREPLIMWISNPLAAYLRKTVATQLLIYYCGDDFLEFPETDKDLLREQEDTLLKEADICIFSSLQLYNSKGSRVSKKKFFLPHGVDFEAFSNRRPSIPPELTSIKGPVVGYFGIFSDWIDLGLFKRVAKMDQAIQYVLIGEPNEEASKLRSLPNVMLLGKLPYEEIKRYAKQFDVGMLLYKKNNMTMAISPLKMYEYYSMGIPIVSTRTFKGLDGAEEIYCGTTPDEFHARIREALKCSSRKKQHLVEIAANNTWEVRQKELTRLIQGALQI